MKNVFSLRAKVWLYDGHAAWHFLSLPKKQSEEIERTFEVHKAGWGSLPVEVTIGSTTWKTSIFPDSKQSVYLLPLKKEVRVKEKISKGDVVTFKIKIRI